MCGKGVGLLTNLVESCAANRQRLIQEKCLPPYDCHYSQTDDGSIDCIEALGMVSSLLLQRYQLVRKRFNGSVAKSDMGMGMVVIPQ